jgi:hypothetical protein
VVGLTTDSPLVQKSGRPSQQPGCPPRPLSARPRRRPTRSKLWRILSRVTGGVEAPVPDQPVSRSCGAAEPAWAPRRNGPAGGSEPSRMYSQKYSNAGDAHSVHYCPPTSGTTRSAAAWRCCCQFASRDAFGPSRPSSALQYKVYRPGGAPSTPALRQTPGRRFGSTTTPGVLAPGLHE